MSDGITCAYAAHMHFKHIKIVIKFFMKHDYIKRLVDPKMKIISLITLMSFQACKTFVRLQNTN